MFKHGLPHEVKIILDIQLSSISFPYRNHTLKFNLSFSLKKHDIIGLYGTIGSGKSTICKIAAAIIPFEQKASIKGNVVWHFKEGYYALESLSNPEPIYQNIGYVDQNPEKNFICEFVEDELAFNMEMRGFSSKDIYSKLSTIFHKYDLFHLLKKRVTQLSGGEKQLIAVLSSVIHAPELLILDEPTAQLDRYWSDALSDHLSAIAKIENLAILFSSHKQKFLESLSNNIIFLSSSPPSKKASFNKSKNNECPSTPVLSIRNLDVNRNGEQLISDISLDLYPGDSALLIGQNGSGKSTFLETIAGFQKITPKSIQIFKNKPSLFPRTMQFAFQNPDHQIFTDSVESELMLGLRAGNYSAGEKSEKLKVFVDNLQFLSNQRDADPRQLSWGQKKIMNILISFCLLDLDKSILLLDEPDLALDTNHIFKLQELFETAREHGVTILTITHNWELYLNLVSRVFLIKDGKLKEVASLGEGSNINE